MQSLFFWKSWPAEYRRLWYGCAFVFLISLLFLWFTYFQGVSGVIQWDTIEEQKVVETVVHSFKLGPFTLNVPGEGYVLFEYFNGSPVQPNVAASYFFLAILALGAVVLLTVMTTLERFWFYVAMGLFVLFIVSLRFEVLGLFGQYNRGPEITIIALYLLPSFYFSLFSKTTPLVIRLAIMAAITMAVGVVVAFFSSVPIPFYHLTLTGYTAGMALTILFIIMVAHEIIASFVYLVSKGSSKSLRHLSIISAIYLANLFLTSLHEMDVIRWNFIYLNIYLLLTISAIVGIWGFKEREVLYDNIISFAPFGGLFFLAMGAISFATVGQLLGNANDPPLKVITDVVIFSHTGYGLIFLTYLFSNFILMLARNIDISKILYRPNRMPYFTYRFAGLIAMLAFILVSDWKRYVYQSTAGFYNSAGDMYTLLGNDKYAESFYNQGSERGFGNHRSNYAMAIERASRFNFEGAAESYSKANLKRPSEYSMTNAGNVLVWNRNLFGSIDSYHHALKKFPGSGVLANNLGLSYAKVHNLDSALMYFDMAREHSISKDMAEANFFAMVVQEHIPVRPDSILKVFDSHSPATVANALALALFTRDSITTTMDPLENRKLDLFTATFLNNYLLQNAKTLDSAVTARVNEIVYDSLNDDYSIALKSSLAFAYYHQGNVAKALALLAEQVYVSQVYQGKFNYIQGLWALEQGSPLMASSYFTYADTYEYKSAKFYNAIALSEAMKVMDAWRAWDEVSKGKDEGEKQIAERMKSILTLSLPEAMTLPDAEKYQYCRYRLLPGDSVAFNRVVNTFQNTNYKAQALLDMSRKFYAVDEVIPAIRFFNRTAGLELTDRRLYEELRHFELRMLATRRELRLLATQINKGVAFGRSQVLEKMLYTALISEAGDDFEKARKNYEVLGSYNPYFEEGTIAAAEFFQKQDPDGMKSYNILSEAIQINSKSIKLLKAYIVEASRKGFDDYAASAAQRLQELLAESR